MAALQKCPKCLTGKMRKYGTRIKQVRTLKGVVDDVLTIYICYLCRCERVGPSEIAPYLGRIGWDVIEHVVKTKKDTGMTYEKISQDLRKKYGVRVNTAGIHRIYKKYGGTK